MRLFFRYFLPIAVAGAALLHGCENTPPAATATAAPVAASNGFTPLQTYCMSCHASSSTVAPGFPEIKQQYLATAPGEAAFIEAIATYLNHPGAETTKLPQAVKQYGPMPKLSIEEAQVQAIARFLYQTDLTKPTWYEDQLAYAQAHPGEAFKPNPVALGQQYALATKAVLGKNLLQAIKAKGPAGAVDFCQTRAIPLTDSMGQGLKLVSIKRVSDKPRNPANQANAAELAYIAQAKTALAKGEKAKPAMTEINGNMVGYYGIETNAMCLQCHGTLKKTINPETLEAIHRRYPADKATGYGENELRGIWVVEMAKKP